MREPTHEEISHVAFEFEENTWDAYTEIVRLREALAAATRVTEAMADTAFRAYVERVFTFGVFEMTAADEDRIRHGIRAALTAALAAERGRVG